MSHVADPDYLRKDQYRDSSHLRDRASIHARFSTNPQSWHRWVFDHFRFAPGSRLLELGGGPGLLWRANRDRLSDGWRVILSDFSPGMVAEARQHLAAHGRFAFLTADAQALPFPDGSFDGVIANHMLYHVPDRPQAFAEIRRVLRADGRLFAATNGRGHMQELDGLLRRFDPAGRSWRMGDQFSANFGLENGQAQLAPFFHTVTRHDFADGLIVTEAEPLVAYVFSLLGSQGMGAERRAAFRDFIEAELAAHGPIQITKETGLFEAGAEDRA
jgi:SAM-dependent methyltransferase